MIELIPLQSEGSGFLWTVFMLITVYWIYKIETGGSSSGDSRTRRDSTPQKTSPGSTRRTSADDTQVSTPEPEPEPKSDSIDDDRDVGVDREPYAERLERPEFGFDDAESRTASDGSDNPPELPETDDLLDQLDLDDLSEDQ